MTKPAREPTEGAQLSLPFDTVPHSERELLRILKCLGLRGITHCRITNNRAVMLSHGNGVLRIHRAYLSAPDEVLGSIVRFVCPRSRAERRDARRMLLAFTIPDSDRAPLRRPVRLRPGDSDLINRLGDWHREYNARFFKGALGSIEIRVSHKMRRRLGQYTATSPAGEPAEISISRSHIRRHGWSDVLHTLLHEMVHQWQAESGYELGHGRTFRDKARQVGISACACREVGHLSNAFGQSDRELVTRVARQCQEAGSIAGVASGSSHESSSRRESGARCSVPGVGLAQHGCPVLGSQPCAIT
ncbi:MAG: SprT-like domain-containing protein [Gemmatimonadaceae bacterium]